MRGRCLVLRLFCISVSKCLWSWRRLACILALCQDACHRRDSSQIFVIFKLLACFLHRASANQCCPFICTLGPFATSCLVKSGHRSHRALSSCSGWSFLPVARHAFPAVILDAVRCQSLSSAALAAFVPLHASMRQCPFYTHPGFAKSAKQGGVLTGTLQALTACPSPFHKLEDYWIRHACRDRDL